MITAEQAKQLRLKNRPILIKRQMRQVYKRIKDAAKKDLDKVYITDLYEENIKELRKIGFGISEFGHNYTIKWDNK